MRKPITVFLDQNHWIYLAQSYWGSPHKPCHKEVADDLYNYILNGEARFPLNLLHLIEHTRNDSSKRRTRLAEVYERFSQSWFFTAWNDLISLEIERAVFKIFAPEIVFKPLEVVGRGYLFGINPKVGEGWPALPSNLAIEFLKNITAQPGHLYKLLTFPNEDGRNRQKTYIKNLNDRNAKAVEDLRAIRHSYPIEMHRRAQYAGYTCDFQESINKALMKVGKVFDDFIALGVGGLSKFWQSVPSLDVDCEMTIYRDRQWSRKIASNDVGDIQYLVSAVPYCKAVVVERFWAHAIEQTRLANKYGVAVFTDIRELANWLVTRKTSRS